MLRNAGEVRDIKIPERTDYQKKWFKIVSLDGCISVLELFSGEGLKMHKISRE